MRKLTKLLIAAATAMSLIIGSATQAHAAEVGVVVFTGKATTNPGLFIPGLGGTNGTWNFTSGNPNNPVDPVPCVTIAVSSKKSPPVNATTCNINANGQLVGVDPMPPLNVPYCGLSQGQNGVGGFTAGLQTYTLAGIGWRVSAGGLLVVTGSITKTGTNQQGPGTFVAVVLAMPDPNKYPTGSLACIDTPANAFSIAGVAIYII